MTETFKMPTPRRMQEIMDMIPEMVAVFSQKGEGYSVRISKMGEAMRLTNLCRELGIKISITSMKPTVDYAMSVLKANDVPEFALVISKIGRYHISFDGEDTPAVMLTREFGNECIGGSIYVYQKNLSKRDDHRMFASGAESFYHLNSKLFMVLGG